MTEQNNWRSDRRYEPIGLTLDSFAMAFFSGERHLSLKKFVGGRVHRRKTNLYQAVRSVCQVIQEILKEVEAQEPRFISSLKEDDGRYQGLHVRSPCCFEVHLFLNQMGVFNFLDDGCPAGCAMLKLSDERKRSMSLWTEFITASGYLSARKIHSRFTSLITEAISRTNLEKQVRLSVADSQFSAKLVVSDRYTVELIPAFRCGAIWPQIACVWPSSDSSWPSQTLVASIKQHGFNLLADDPLPSKQVQGCSEGDAWLLSFSKAQEILLAGGCRKLCLSILMTICDQHLELPGKPIEYVHLVTLVLHECVKHPREFEWSDGSLVDRVNGCFLQLVSCLQCRSCPHFFLKDVDLFASKSKEALDCAAKETWKIVRDLATNPCTFDTL